VNNNFLFYEINRIQTDGAHPFSGKAMQEYCARDNKLFEIIIVDGDDDAI
jgi:hypothetical protein